MPQDPQVTITVITDSNASTNATGSSQVSLTKEPLTTEHLANLFLQYIIDHQELQRASHEHALMTCGLTYEEFATMDAWIECMEINAISNPEMTDQEYTRIKVLAHQFHIWSRAAWENSDVYKLYWAAVSEFTNKVLARMVNGNINIP